MLFCVRLIDCFIVDCKVRPCILGIEKRFCLKPSCSLVTVRRLIDCFAVDSAVTSLSMSPTDDFLATCHVGDLGVYLWANRTLYAFVSLQPLPEDFEPRTLHMPATADRPAGE